MWRRPEKRKKKHTWKCESFRSSDALTAAGKQAKGEERGTQICQTHDTGAQLRHFEGMSITSGMWHWYISCQGFFEGCLWILKLSQDSSFFMYAVPDRCKSNLYSVVHVVRLREYNLPTWAFIIFWGLISYKKNAKKNQNNKNECKHFLFTFAFLFCLLSLLCLFFLFCLHFLCLCFFFLFAYSLLRLCFTLSGHYIILKDFSSVKQEIIPYTNNFIKILHATKKQRDFFKLSSNKTIHIIYNIFVRNGSVNGNVWFIAMKVQKLSKAELKIHINKWVIFLEQRGVFAVAALCY